MAHRCRLLRRICFLRRRRASQKGPAEPSSSSSSSSASPETRRRNRSRPKKGPKKRVAVVVWKRLTRVLRRESKRGVPAGFALIIPHAHAHRISRCDPDPDSPETTVAATYSETGSDWSVV
ncbi:hypothetical protein EI94DRAFT_1701952 [Lactarius quietus]|nr:hypothetical protein EI94DRAFT_1701952 [Lactarius quietus]